MNCLDTPPIPTLIYPCHSAGGIPLSAGLVSSGLICPSVFALRATPRHASLRSSSYARQAADSHYVMGSPYGSLTRSYICCCMPIFVFPAPCGVGFDGGQDAMTHRRRGFVRPVLPDSPVIFSAVPTSETQRVSRGKHRLLSAHDRQIYVVWPYDG